MSPLIATMPREWLTTILAAQGCAIQCVLPETKKELLRVVPEVIEILAKAVMYQAYLLNKAGVTGTEDYIEIASQTQVRNSTSGIVGVTLTSMIDALDGVYEEIKLDKGLISDMFSNVKQTTH
jgi:hypothetical protein